MDLGSECALEDFVVQAVLMRVGATPSPQAKLSLKAFEAPGVP